jgi:hypothetical protein
VQEAVPLFEGQREDEVEASAVNALEELLLRAIALEQVALEP